MAHDDLETHAAAKARIPKVRTRSVVHATFHLERVYGASRTQIWKALTDPAAKALWFGAVLPSPCPLPGRERGKEIA